jgi:CHASE2 domain-containing sensor protein
MGLFASITFFKVFDFFDPISEMFEDFELTDIVFSQLQEDPIADDRIVVVNIGRIPREGIARQLEIINKYHPKVIGLDVMLDQQKPWSEDSALARVLSETPTIVLAEDLQFDLTLNKAITPLQPNDHLRDYGDLGFVDLLTNAESQDDLKMCREFLTRQEVDGQMHYAFAVKLAMAADSVKTQKFLERGKLEETINYKGNVFSYTSSQYGMKYFVLDVHDVFEENFTKDLLEDKIVIMCHLGLYLGDLNTNEDLYFTPLNKNYVGKAEHDMFGGVVHANIVSMILDEDYINEMTKTQGIFLAIMMCLINVFLFKIVYAAAPKWYDGITKVFQLIEVLFFATLMIYIFYYFNYKADFTLTLIVIALSGDSIEVYHGVVKNLFSKKSRRQILQINRQFWK